ncbi:helix-turn-helix domain-containing protein [Rariglobus hedericola]|uniref:Helix-turn-helix domain-containing protein n=1 Tax=Rariglobus hedericola TaxID=2597822 RepID=A0A556QPI2_9BACT|nr:helix-turn-helix domain-containing protein [Rariglobus hedericola]TSJ78554.1 helix-turn-helix domain-containing protein [Rariglobus hedericola]
MAVLAKGIDYFGAEGFPITARRVRTEPGGRPSHRNDVTEIDHYHDFSELVLILRGRGRHLLEGESFPVVAGNVFVVQGNQVHSFRDREDLVVVNVMYDPMRVLLPAGLLRRLPGYSALFLLEPTFRSAHQFSSRLQLDREDLGAAEALVERIESESKQAYPGHEAILLGLLIELMVFLSRRYGESDVRESRALLEMGKLISTLEQRFNEPWTLAEMARFARVSRTNLLRVFRQATGKSPIDYLIGLRIEAAKRLLRQSNRSMTEIGIETGFGDSNYFARQFRLVAGRTPSEFRRSGRT